MKAASKGQPHLRSRSFSVNEDQNSDGSKDGVLKIVIDRAGSHRRKSADTGIPALEVSIPSYRLGTPRFSTHGTPFLRSSIYTRSSYSENRASSAIRPDFDTLFPAPPLRTPTGRQEAYLQPGQLISEAYSGVTRSSAALPSPGIYSVKQPIEPHIFDLLSSCMDDPAVVRFSSKTGEITAATPARIIAQISSESFMDYELVSDFFLTFRSYLSCQNVLNLLLARLKWAINRPQEDGRIIRIRTFAALRHWILNYFLDDFASNRDIRIQFCDQINTMYREVRARTGGGVSDLKILLDLKRCWNGRCSMVWESQYFPIDGQQEAAIIPGGDEEVRPQHLQPQKQKSFDRNSGVGMELQDSGLIKSGNWIDISDEKANMPESPRVSQAPIEPVSPTSERSLQPISCSIPRGLKRTPPPPADLKLVPRPVPLQSSATSPAPAIQPRPAQRPSGHTHKRSGSFADSIRDGRRSVDETDGDPMAPSSLNSSLIRGQKFPPGDAVVDVLAPLSPTVHLTNSELAQIDTEQLRETALRAGGPGMKTFMGSIRRALSTRQGPAGHTKIQDTSSLDHTLRGKTSTLPGHVAAHNNALKEKKSSPALRRHARIDLLCAEVHESYQAALATSMPRPPSMIQGIGIASGNESEQPSLPRDSASGPEQDATSLARYKSAITSGSRSIVIVDDTGHTMPTMSGAVAFSRFHDLDQGKLAPNDENEIPPEQVKPQPHDVASQRSSGALGIRRSVSLRPYDDVRDSSDSYGGDYDRSSQRHPLSSLLRRSLSLGDERRTRSMKTQSVSTTLRRYASYQSSMSRRVANSSLDNTATTVSVSYGSPNRDPPRLLRRRPGGDLRKFQNVHDLEPSSRPSPASWGTATDSAPGSLLLMASQPKMNIAEATNTPREMPEKHVSMMRTHSSQRMRPSFEAVVKNFAEIPDDDDGGLEATLMKLEGRYDRRLYDLDSMGRPSSPIEIDPYQQRWSDEDRQVEIYEAEVSSGTASQILPDQCNDQSQPESSPGNGLRASISRRISPIFALATASMTGSEESYSSIPLLERGLQDESMRKPQEIPHSDPALPRPLFSRNNTENHIESPESSHPSIDMVEETESMKRIEQGSAMPDSQDHSFLLDEEDRLSDLSSELSIDVIDYSEIQPRAISPLIAPPGTAVSGIQIPSHPLTHPPTPPLTGHLESHKVEHRPHHQFPLTPDPSPTISQRPNALAKQLGPAPEPAAQITPNVGHIAFIMAYDSELLAQQFTLVEKAALSEVDWSDLVDMKWDSKAPTALNWVEYLRSKEHKGIDLVTTRFNLMVKWVLSEIVMTREVQERARTIVKYIHVAAFARKLRNYATMLQIVIGLTSTDCSRLKKSWALVPSSERQILKEMESLVQPIRNFHSLREEMESTDLQEGCIPFVGKHFLFNGPP